MRAEDLIELGDVYVDEDDFEEAYHMYLEAALAGDADACLRLARFYLFGNDYVSRDFYKGVHFMELDYERSGWYRTGIILAELLEEGMEEADWKGAYRHYIDFMIDHEEWHFLIVKGNELREGGCYPSDVKARIRCYQKAWEHGLTMGRECLGEMYYLGQGLPRDYKKAYDIWMSYEGSGSFAKIYYLGEMYYYGRYVEQDLNKAKELFEQISYDKRYPNLEDYFSLKAKEKLKEMNE